LAKAKLGQFDQLVQLVKFELNPEELAVLRAVCHYPEVVREAAKELSPSLLCTYLYDLAGKFNLFYNRHRILPSEFRLALTSATGQVLQNGLTLLGIQKVEKM
jgi:arginyl-tRNA synthetase